MFAVTIDNLPGFEVKEVLGQVLGVVARPRNAYVEGVKSLSGGAAPNASDALVRAREVAIAHMLQVAYQRGANAVVGMRFDHRPVSESWNEICAYGTAVFVIPAPRHGPEGEPGTSEPGANEPGTNESRASEPRAIAGPPQE